MRGWEHITTTAQLQQVLKDRPATIAGTPRHPAQAQPRAHQPPTDIEEQAGLRLQRLAKQHGWVGEDCWDAEDGLRCLLARGTELLYVQVLRPAQPASAEQAKLLRALRETGHIEVFVTPASALEQVEVRLMHRRVGARESKSQRGASL